MTSRGRQGPRSGRPGRGRGAARPSGAGAGTGGNGRAPARTGSVLGRSAAFLQGAAGNQAVARLMVQRHPVAGTPIHRHTHADLFDPPGTTLEDFEQSIRRQADWFVEPSLTAADRTDLHALLRRAAEGPHILAGAGDLLLADLRGLSPADWTALAAFGRACHGADTVRITSAAAYPLAQRIRLGNTLLALEGVIPKQVLHNTVAEAQLVDVDAGGLVPRISAYWIAFDPHLEGTYEPGPGARAAEFQGVLDLVRGVGHAPFMPLRGRVRNLHRFSVAMLNKLVANFADVTRSRPVHLVLHTGHDAPGAFLASARLFEDLVVNSPNLVLFLEGQGSLASITAEVPVLAARHGRRDAGGTPRIGQVMIAGHGEARSVELAGTGAPDAAGRYPSESLDLDHNLAQTQALLDALLRNMDPATARMVFAGCLVGSNPVPADVPAGGVAAHIAAHPSLATFTQQRARALGLPAGFTTQAARASVGLGGATSLRDGAGNLAINHPSDPDAFGTAAAYLATGHEPDGYFRAAVEVAAMTTPVNAETIMRRRLAAGASSPDPWWDQCTLALLRVALRPVAVGAGIDVGRLNSFAHAAGTPFLGRWGNLYGITVAHYVGAVNPHPDAAAIYTELVGAGTMSAPPDQDARIGRLMLEQGWLASGGARVAPLIAYLDAMPATFTARTIAQHLDTAAIGAHSAALFPAGAAVTPGRARLALAWLHKDPANADVRAFLDGQVLTPAAGPELSGPVRAELGGFTENEVLEALDRLVAVAPAGGGGPALPAANAEVRRAGRNLVRIEPQPYEARVIPHVLNVRSLPGMHGTPFAWPHAGDALAVVGFTHDWAAVDVNGRLGFVHRTKITPP